MSEFIDNDGTGPHPDATLEEIVFADEQRITFSDLTAAGISKAKYWDFTRTNGGRITKYRLRQ